MGCLVTAPQAAPDLAASLSLLAHLSFYSQAPRMGTHHVETCPHCCRHTAQGRGLQPARRKRQWVRVQVTSPSFSSIAQLPLLVPLSPAVG